MEEENVKPERRKQPGTSEDDNKIMKKENKNNEQTKSRTQNTQQLHSVQLVTRMTPSMLDVTIEMAEAIYSYAGRYREAGIVQANCPYTYYMKAFSSNGTGRRITWHCLAICAFSTFRLVRPKERANRREPVEITQPCHIIRMEGRSVAASGRRTTKTRRSGSRTAR